MKYSIEDHFELHKRRHKKNWTPSLKHMSWFKTRWGQFSKWLLTYEEVIETPSLTNMRSSEVYRMRHWLSYDANREKNTKKKKVTMASRCRDMRLNYQKVYQYLMKNPMNFNQFIQTADLSDFTMTMDIIK